MNTNNGSDLIKKTKKQWFSDPSIKNLDYEEKKATLSRLGINAHFAYRRGTLSKRVYQLFCNWIEIQRQVIYAEKVNADYQVYLATGVYPSI